MSTRSRGSAISGSDPSPGRDVASSDSLIPERLYARNVCEVAADLVGATLVLGEVAVRVTEVEAYGGPEDSASHGRFGRTERNAPMWGPPGRAYVYLCYGLHWMLNVVTGREGEASAVLIRACEPLRGLETLRRRRRDRRGPDLLNGPGKVGAALGLDRSWNHHRFFEAGGLEIHSGTSPPAVAVGKRVGIDYAAPADREVLWRFAWPDSAWVSHPRGLRCRSEAESKSTDFGDVVPRGRDQSRS